jgi:hypothetical protein
VFGGDERLLAGGDAFDEVQRFRFHRSRVDVVDLLAGIVDSGKRMPSFIVET